MTFDEFMIRMLTAFPKAEVEQDNEGNLVIYPNLTLDDNGNVIDTDDKD